MRRPVCPVAPATSNVLASAALAPETPETLPETVKRAPSRARRLGSSKVGAKGWVGDDDIYAILLIYPEFLGVLKDFSRDLMIKRVG